MSRYVRNSVISFVALVLLLLLLGVAYVRFSSSDANVKPAKITTGGDTAPAVFKPTPPNPNTPESAAVESITSPAAAGSNVALLVRTKPTSSCTISVVYNNIASTDSGLTAKTADAYGTISWTWTIGKTVAPGPGKATVTCAFNRKTAVVEAVSQVVPPAAVNNQN